MRVQPTLLAGACCEPAACELVAGVDRAPLTNRTLPRRPRLGHPAGRLIDGRLGPYGGGVICRRAQSAWHVAVGRPVAAGGSKRSRSSIGGWAGGGGIATFVYDGGLNFGITGGYEPP